MLLVGCASQKDVDLVDAALSGDLARVQALLKQGANIEATAFDGLTSLDAAANEGHLDVVKYLVAAGAAVNGTTNGNQTHTDCAMFLISHGGQLRGTKAWKQGLLDLLKRHNKVELYELMKQQIDRESNGS